MSTKRTILDQQRRWAIASGLDLDARGYLSHYQLNLYQPLAERSLLAFSRGSGSELSDTAKRSGKMRALHSSAALAVNLFDTWVERDAAPLLRALQIEAASATVGFEAKYPTGLPGNPPNLDVVLDCDDGTLVAIESKFTEWLLPKPARGRLFKDKYFPPEIAVWSRVGLPASQQLASRLQAGEIGFRHLHAAQLL